MQDWLNPAWVQYGLAPFIAALVVAELFNRMRISGFALLAGLAVTTYLNTRALPSITPVSALERILFVAMLASLLGLVLDLAPRLRRPLTAVVALCAGTLVIWVAWPAVTLDNWLLVLGPAGLGVVYAVWTAGSLNLLADFPERAAAAGVGLGAAIGACALLAGTPLLAAPAFAVASASGAYLLIQVFSNARLSCGALFVLPLAAICALVPPVAVLNAGLSWYLLPALALVPAAALIPLSERLSARVRSLLALAVAAFAGAGVAAIAWTVIGPPVK